MKRQDKKAEIKLEDREVETGKGYGHAYLKWRTMDLRERVERDLEALKINECRGRTILDVGCGMGDYGMSFARRGNLTVGIDLSLKALKAAKEWARQEEVMFLPLVGDIEKLPFRDDSFDMRFCGGVLHHFPDMEPVIAELARILKPGGRIGLSEPNGSNPISLLSRLIASSGAGWLARFGFPTTPNITAHTRKQYVELLEKYGFTDIRATTRKVSGKTALEPQSHLGLSKIIFYLLISLYSLALKISETVLPKAYGEPVLLILAVKS